MDEKQIEARIEALERKLAEFERHTTEVLSNFGASLNSERRIVANLIEAVVGKRPRGRDKGAAN